MYRHATYVPPIARLPSSAAGTDAHKPENHGAIVGLLSPTKEFAEVSVNREFFFEKKDEGSPDQSNERS
jgi:hypothetical protein